MAAELSRQHTRAIVFLLLSICAAAHLLLGFFCLPVMDGDAYHYMPAILNNARGLGLTNPFHALHQHFDPTGQGRYLYHGFLFQAFSSRILPRASLTDLHLVFRICGLLTLGIVLLVIGIQNHRKKAQLESCDWFFLLLLVTSFSTYVLSLTGRVEPFVMLFSALLLLAITLTPQSLHWALVGLYIAIVAATDPGVTPIAVAGIAVYLALTQTCAAWLKQIIGSGIVAVSVFAVLFWALYPYPFSDWFHAILLHAQVSALSRGNLFSLQEALWYWFLSGGTPLMGLACLLMLIAFWHKVRSSKLRSPLLLKLSLTLLLLVVFFLCLRSHNQSYYLAAFFPMGYSAIFEWYHHIRNRRGNGQPALLNTRIVILYLGLTATSIGFARSVLQMAWFFRHGVPAEQAQAKIAELEHSVQGLLGLSTLFWFAPKEPHRFRAIPASSVTPPTELELEYIILQQANTARLSPPVYPGYDLVFDNFVKQPPAVLGIKIGRVGPSYQLAVYRKQGVMAGKER